MGQNLDQLASDGAFCAGRLPGWEWLSFPYSGRFRCLRCDSVAQADLTDKPRLLKCVGNCASSWTLAGLCRDFPQLYNP